MLWLCPSHDHLRDGMAPILHLEALQARMLKRGVPASRKGAGNIRFERFDVVLKPGENSDCLLLRRRDTFEAQRSHSAFPLSVPTKGDRDNLSAGEVLRDGSVELY